jgi:cytochrome P450
VLPECICRSIVNQCKNQLQIMNLLNTVHVLFVIIRSTLFCMSQVTAAGVSWIFWISLTVALFVVLASTWKFAASIKVKGNDTLTDSVSFNPQRSSYRHNDNSIATNTPKQNPPGPWRFPVVGTLAMLGRNWILSLSRLRARYGDVFRVSIGVRDIVVINGWRTIRAALANGSGTARQLAGRPNLHGFRLASEGKAMSFNGYSRIWRLHRRIAERALARAMFETKFMETIVVREARILMDLFISKGQPMANDGGRSPTLSFDPEQAVVQSIAHAMFSLCYGDSRRSQFADMLGADCPLSCPCPLSSPNDDADINEDFDSMINCSQCIVRSHDKGSIVDFFPWARPLLHSSLSTLNHLCAAMLAATRRMTARHRATRRDGVVRDVLDALIDAADTTEAGRMLGAERVEMTVQEFIGAGLDILAAALLWMIAYMAEHPDVQDRVRREADAAAVALASADGEPGADAPGAAQGGRTTLTPFADSVVLEVLRHSCVVPVALPHATIGDMLINGTFLSLTV